VSVARTTSQVSPSALQFRRDSSRREEPGWESWTRGKSRRIYSTAVTVSIGFLATARLLSIGTGKKKMPGVRANSFAPPSDGKNHFAELKAGLEIHVRGGSLGERKDAIHDRFQPSGGDEPHHAVQFGLGTHVGTKQR